MGKEAIKFFLKGFGKRKAGIRLPVPKSIAKGLNVPETRTAYEGYKRQAKKRGVDSFVASVPLWAAEKLVGKDKVQRAVWKSISKPALIADTATGNVLRKIPGAKKLFSVKEKIPWGNQKDFYREVQRSSALAPLVKVRQFAAPIIVGVGLEKGIDKAVGLAKSQNQNNTMTKSALAEKLGSDKALREKAASVMLELHEKNKEHEKRAEATRLLFKQLEMGVGDVPRTHGEFEEKIASLVSQDLEVYEKALELSGAHTQLGDIGSAPDFGVSNAEEKFQADIMGSELNW